MDKQCSKCKQAKSLGEFGKNKKRTDGLQPYCKKCSSQIHKEHYQRSKKRKSDIAQARDFTRRRNKTIIWNYLLDNPCVDCGESDPIVLEFDHQRNKEQEVSTMVNGASVERLMNEIAKCEVRCANCHRRKTAKQFNYHKGLCEVWFGQTETSTYSSTQKFESKSVTFV